MATSGALTSYTLIPLYRLDQTAKHPDLLGTGAVRQTDLCVLGLVLVLLLAAAVLDGRLLLEVNHQAGP